MTEPVPGRGPARPDPADLRTARPGRPADGGAASTPSGSGSGGEAGSRLWPGDHGTLPAAARLALARLVRGPYLAAEPEPDTWRALLAHEDVVRERLADQYLDLVVDGDAQVAFVRDVPAADAPQVVREVTLTFLDTALLLHLRALLLDSADGCGVFMRSPSPAGRTRRSAPRPGPPRTRSAARGRPCTGPR